MITQKGQEPLPTGYFRRRRRRASAGARRHWRKQLLSEENAGVRYHLEETSRLWAFSKHVKPSVLKVKFSGERREKGVRENGNL